MNATTTPEAGRLTTHVLHTARGMPAAGMRIALFRCDGDDRMPPGNITEMEPVERATIAAWIAAGTPTDR